MRVTGADVTGDVMGDDSHASRKRKTVRRFVKY